MSNPLVSIIIPCYNAERYMGDAIKSALCQTYPRKEVIVIDDGSTDGSAAVAERFGTHIRYILTENAGAAAARNRGIAHSAGELIQFLDCDDLLHPDKLERQVPCLRNDRTSVVFCNASVQRGDTGQVVATWGASSPDVPDPVVFVLTRALQTSLPIHWKENLLAAGGFREDMPPCEDPDLHLRLACAGLRFRHIPESLITLRRFAGSLSDRNRCLLRQLEMRMVLEAYRSMLDNSSLTPARRAGIAGFVAKVGRRCLRDGLRDRAMECFRIAADIDPAGGIPQAYSSATGKLYRLLGPVITERVAGIARRFVAGPQIT